MDGSNKAQTQSFQDRIHIVWLSWSNVNCCHSVAAGWHIGAHNPTSKLTKGHYMSNFSSYSWEYETLWWHYQKILGFEISPNMAATPGGKIFFLKQTFFLKQNLVMSHIKVKLIMITLRIYTKELYFSPNKSPRGQKPKWPTSTWG